MQRSTCHLLMRCEGVFQSEDQQIESGFREALADLADKERSALKVHEFYYKSRQSLGNALHIAIMHK